MSQYFKFIRLSLSNGWKVTQVLRIPNAEVSIMKIFFIYFYTYEFINIFNKVIHNAKIQTKFQQQSIQSMNATVQHSSQHFNKIENNKKALNH